VQKSFILDDHISKLFTDILQFCRQRLPPVRP